MFVPNPTKNTLRLIMTIGRHQDGEKGVTDLAEDINQPLSYINSDLKSAINAGLVRDTTEEQRKTVLELTEEGEKVYEALEQMAEALQD